MSVITFEGIRRAFKPGENVLDGVSFSLEAGEVVGLLGRNGVGKTTLLKIAMGMLHAHEGTVSLFGLDPWKDAIAIKRRLGYVAEDQMLPASLRVADLLALHRHLFAHWDDEFAQSLLERFDLDARARIRTLSKGQARQVALLCAVAHQPELLILDEPGGGLDPAARREFLEMAIALLNRAGTTVLFSSHHMADVERIAQRVVVLGGGHVLLDRPLDALREEVTLLTLPRTVDESSVRSLPGCLRVHVRNDRWHALLDAPPREAAALARERLGTDDATSASLPLEELFVELVGGAS